MSNGKSVLLVDDEPGIRAVVGRALRKSGFDVDEAGDGRVALACFEKRPYDIAILDIVMPLNGGHRDSH